MLIVPAFCWEVFLGVSHACYVIGYLNAYGIVLHFIFSVGLPWCLFPAFGAFMRFGVFWQLQL